MAILRWGMDMLIEFNLPENICTEHIFDALEDNEFNVRFLFKPDYCIVQLINRSHTILHEFVLPKSFFCEYPVYSSFKLGLKERIKPRLISYCVIDTVKLRMTVYHQDKEDIPLEYLDSKIEIPYANGAYYPASTLLCGINDLKSVAAMGKKNILIKQVISNGGRGLSFTPFNNNENVSESIVFRRNYSFEDNIDNLKGISKSKYNMEFFEQVIGVYPPFCHANFYITFLPKDDSIFGLRAVYNNDVRIISYISPLLDEGWERDFMYKGAV